MIFKALFFEDFNLTMSKTLMVSNLDCGQFLRGSEYERARLVEGGPHALKQKGHKRGIFKRKHYIYIYLLFI